MSDIKMPEKSKWECWLFGSYKSQTGGLIYTPQKGSEPNWFWRWMQFICFGNKWVRRTR